METYNGHVSSPGDAIILFEACRLGILPRVQRRLSEKERQSIRTGSVFVWDEREAGMRRWTDGKSWSASRVSGSFLTYREMEGKRGGAGFAPPVTNAGKTPESRNSGDDADDGPAGYNYKPDGLMKQSFSITTSSGQHLHLISYFSRASHHATNLPKPTTDPTLRNLRPPKGMYPESTINDTSNMPAVTRSPMAGAPSYVTQSPQPPPYHPRPSAPPPPPQHYIQAPMHHPGYVYPQGPIGAGSNGYPVHYPYGPGPNTGGLPPVGPNGHYQGHYYPQQPPMPMHQPPPMAYDQRPIRTPDVQVSHSQPPPNAQYSSAGPPNVTHAYAQQQPYYGQQSQAPHGPSPPQQNAAALQIDPRLFGDTTVVPVEQSSGDSAGHSVNGANGSVNTGVDQNPPETKPAENGATPSSAASQAPTIGAIVNGGDSTDDTANKENKQNSEQADGSAANPDTTPQDIPSEKLGFREDSRALRQLDKNFAA